MIMTPSIATAMVMSLFQEKEPFQRNSEMKKTKIIVDSLMITLDDIEVRMYVYELIRLAPYIKGKRMTAYLKESFKILLSFSF